MWAFLADVAVEDCMEQLNEASSLLKQEGAPKVADELTAQWFAATACIE